MAYERGDWEKVRLGELAANNIISAAMEPVFRAD